jgi:hypothetical protein
MALAIVIQSSKIRLFKVLFDVYYISDGPVKFNRPLQKISKAGCC